MILRALELVLFLASIAVAGQIGRAGRKLNRIQDTDTQDR